VNLRQVGPTTALRVLQVSTYDIIGGAERVAWNLFQTYRMRGHASWLAVGTKLGTDPDVLPIPNYGSNGVSLGDPVAAANTPQSPAARGWILPRPGALTGVLAHPARALDRFLGIEDFRFPGTRQLLSLSGQRPDVLHCHNLHGGYFDLRLLPSLSHQVPLILTLHDAWLLSGHCAHSFDCERWKGGCGHCPDLTIEPAIRRDATAYNWRRKQRIFRASRLYVATPCQWLMRKVAQSMLAPAIVEARVIPNGVDLSVFHPGDRAEARSALGIPPGALVVLFAATAPRQNMWKDYRTMRESVALAVTRMDGRNLIFIALGQDGPVERVGPAVLRWVPYQREQAAVARYYQAADLYLHAARADTFPNTVLEAHACGLPVVATAVGGIPEQIEDGRNGFLVPAGDAPALAERLTQLLSDHERRARMGHEAFEDARRRFDLRVQADAYLDWYRALVPQGAPVPVDRSD
jgi:glycosyltransferase involved in cell wall biosynthesis